MIPGLVFLIGVSNIAACSGNSPDSSEAGGCCEPDPQPACCMSYGGWAESTAVCGSKICDGMPVPSDPGWKLETDAHGCRVWTNPNRAYPDGNYCGGARLDGGQCCEPNPAPACCMSYGGWSNGDACGSTCDGMPIPSDPGWKLETDEHGCQVWKNPNDFWHGGTRNAATSYCGEITPSDAGSDASDAAPE